jgi:cytochrome b subunit of formate dehydrogenase
MFRPELYVPDNALTRSVHAGATCVECHEDASVLPHSPKLNVSTCAATCHPAEHDAYLESAHDASRLLGDERAPTCGSCHGGHDILAVADRQSPQHRLNSIFLCADCHMTHEELTPGGYAPQSHMEAYFKSAHGKAVVESGLVAAPTCVDCHAAHEVHPVEDERSAVHRDALPETCGGCHVGIINTYEQSIHGQLLAQGDERAPVCADCHKSHEIVRPDEVEFKIHSDERCGQCHEDMLERYRETFHGKALMLGRPGVASCFNCHGQHDITRVADPESHLAGPNKLETCRECHPKATGMFASYIAHADHYDREDYPELFWTFVLMTTIVVGTFLFFGIHTLLWLSRSGKLYFKDPKAFRELKIKSAKDEKMFVRFRPFERFLHVLVMISFLLLVATGMPLKFYDAGWAKTMVGWAGGLEATAQLHRFGAIITFTYFALHLSALLKAMFRHSKSFRNPKTGRYSLMQYFRVVFGPDMPLPTFHDVKDFWAHQKWFFGRGPRPQFDKWTYWEKFDYFAVFWGVAIIGVSGLVMWFPEFFTKFIPGWTINVALIVHSDEALLAAGFIFTFHFFNVHFRPEKFPIDPVIFSGRISETEMLHERRRWYDRLKAKGHLDEIEPRDEWHQWKKFVHPLGMMAFGFGIILLILILYAMGLRLFGGHP